MTHRFSTVANPFNNENCQPEHYYGYTYLCMLQECETIGTLNPQTHTYCLELSE